ncbi:MAG: hypothetical protein ACE5JX_10200 [Acidobacteriota bacterium]
MRDLKTQIRVTIALGVVALLAGLLSHLALSDIYHAEADVSLEWSVVRIGALVFVAFLASALFTLGRALKVLS